MSLIQRTMMYKWQVLILACNYVICAWLLQPHLPLNLNITIECCAPLSELVFSQLSFYVLKSLEAMIITTDSEVSQSHVLSDLSNCWFRLGSCISDRGSYWIVLAFLDCSSVGTRGEGACVGTATQESHMWQGGHGDCCLHLGRSWGEPCDRAVRVSAAHAAQIWRSNRETMRCQW